jgi:hypothetical protein
MHTRVAAASASIFVTLLLLAPETIAQGDHRIVEKRRIGPVAVGMTENALRSALGEPKSKRPSDLHSGWELWSYPAGGLDITIADTHRVWDVRTKSRRYRTARGVGVSSSLATVRRKVARVRCRRYGGQGPRRGWIVCDDGSGVGRGFTEFLIPRDRVIQVKVARGLAF